MTGQVPGRMTVSRFSCASRSAARALKPLNATPPLLESRFNAAFGGEPDDGFAMLGLCLFAE
jgi:hypothetical protein